MEIDSGSSAREIEKAFDDILRDMRKLEIEYQMFFNGARDLPPFDLRRKLDSTITRLRNQSFRNYGHNYRFSSIATRYVTLTELWNKRCRIVEEEGTEAVSPTVRKKSRNIARGKDRNGSSPKRSAGFVIGDNGSDEAIGKMFRSYEAALKKCGSKKSPTLEGFKKTICKQTESILKKKKCKTVSYQIAIEDGKVKIKAKTGK